MKRGWLIGILVVALAARLAMYFSASEATVFTPDSQAYWRLGEALLRGEGFALEGRPEIFRTPGYPAFLSIAHTTAGDAELSETFAPWQVAAILQVLLDTALVALVYALGLLLVSRRAGLVAAGLQAVSPPAIASSCRILSDGLYVLPFTAAALLLVGYLRTGRRWALAVSAALLAGACYVRPGGLAMAAVFLAAVLLRPGRSRQRLAGAAVFAGVMAALLAPWVVRNAVRADYVGFSSLPTEAMYYFAAVEVTAARENRDPKVVREEFRRQDQEWVSAHRATPGQAAAHRRSRAADVLWANPGLYASLHLKGCVGVWLPGATDLLEVAGATTGGRGTLAVLQREGVWAAAKHYFGQDARAVAAAAGLVAILLVKYLLVLACAIGRFRIRMPVEAWALTAIVIVSAILPGVVGVPRFRVPLEPILNVAAGAGLLAIVGAVRGREKGDRQRKKGDRQLFSEKK